MSLLRTIALRAPRAPLAATASKQVRFSTGPFQQKDAGSAVKDTIDSVNKTVGEAAVKGIEKGQQASATLKSTVGLNAKEAEGSAKEMTGEAKGMTGEAKGKASEMMGEAKGKTQEMAGQAKGKAEEVKGKM